MSKETRNPQVVPSYSSAFQRLEQALVAAEDRSWQQIQEEIDQAVKFEQDAARLTKEEASLLAEWLRRDISELLGYMQESGHGLRDWLRFDLDLLEARLRESLLSIADPTRVEQVRLDKQLAHGEGVYVQGEVALPGVLRCTQCDKMICLVETAYLDACHHCGGDFFQRVTRRTQ